MRKIITVILFLFLIPSVCLAGGSRRFDGGDDFITATGFKGITGTGARTVLGWFKCNHSASSGTIIAWGDSSGVNAGRTESFSVESGIFWGRHNASVTFNVGTGFGDNKWHSFALGLPSGGTNNQRVVYLDFTLRSPTFSNGATAINTLSDADLRIGTSLTAINDFNGNLAYIQLFETNLNTNQMFQALNCPGSVPGARMYWNLFGDTPEPDYSGNATNGTVTAASVAADGPPVHFCSAVI